MWRTRCSQCVDRSALLYAATSISIMILVSLSVEPPPPAPLTTILDVLVVVFSLSTITSHVVLMDCCLDPRTHTYNIFRVKFGVPLDQVCKRDIPGPLLVCFHLFSCIDFCRKIILIFILIKPYQIIKHDFHLNIFQLTLLRIFAYYRAKNANCLVQLWIILMNKTKYIRVRVSDYISKIFYSVTTTGVRSNK